MSSLPQAPNTGEGPPPPGLYPITKGQVSGPGPSRVALSLPSLTQPSGV